MSGPTIIDARTPGRTHYKRLLENEHLGQWDLSTPDGSYEREDGTPVRATVVIERVTAYVPAQRRMKKMPDGSRQPERHNKLLIAFSGKRKRWIAGPVCQQAIAGLYGPVLQDWIGKSITLYVDSTVTMGRKRVGGIRVLNRQPTEAPTEDPLDREVDAELRALQDDAFRDERPDAIDTVLAIDDLESGRKTPEQVTAEWEAKGYKPRVWPPREPGQEG